jgi:CheY-like chemotaxis protein
MEDVGEVRGIESGVSSGVLRGVRILIVEDMKVVSEGLERLLRLAGATTQVAATVDEAYRALAEHTFDVVLLDLNLNEQSGIPIAEAARPLPSTPTVLVVTGDPKYLDVEKLEGVGARVVMKMNLGREIVGIVRSVLDELCAGTLPPRSGQKARTKGASEKLEASGSLRGRNAPSLIGSRPAKRSRSKPSRAKSCGAARTTPATATSSLAPPNPPVRGAFGAGDSLLLRWETRSG